MTTTFAVCFLVGLGLSVVSFAAGLDRIHIGAHHHHGKFTLKHGSHGSEQVSPFNVAALTAFLTWFGGTGMVLQQLTRASLAIVLPAAAVLGFAGGSAVNRFLRALMRREKPLQPTSVTGSIGRVTSSIREGGTGEVVFTLNGTRKVAAARAENGRAIDRGAEVVIVRHDKGIAYVCTWAELGA